MYRKLHLTISKFLFNLIQTDMYVYIQNNNMCSYTDTNVTAVEELLYIWQNLS